MAVATWRVDLADGVLTMETTHGGDEVALTLTRENVTVTGMADALTAQEIRVKLGAAIGVAQGELQ